MAIIGYARVSSTSQNLDPQVTRLEENGCTKIFMEKYTGTTTESRQQLKAALNYVRDGDTVVVTKLDRLARSATDLGQIAKQLEKAQVDLKVLDQPIDTTNPQGKLMFNMIGAFAEFERDLIRERCQEGISRAKERGVQFGRPPKLSVKEVNQLKQEFALSITGRTMLAKKYGISRASLYRLASK